jgi:hypothetical protein
VVPPKRLALDHAAAGPHESAEIRQAVVPITRLFMVGCLLILIMHRPVDDALPKMVNA